MRLMRAAIALRRRGGARAAIKLRGRWRRGARRASGSKLRKGADISRQVKVSAGTRGSRGDGQLHAPRAEAMLDHACQPVPAHAPLCLQGCARVTFGSNHRRVWIKDTPARLRIQGRLCETHKGRVV